jgi:hypothetical protein
MPPEQENLEMTTARERELIEMSEGFVKFLQRRGLDPVEASGVLLTAVMMVYHASNFDLSVEQLADRVKQTLLDADNAAKLDVSH